MQDEENDDGDLFKGVPPVRAFAIKRQQKGDNGESMFTSMRGYRIGPIVDYRERKAFEQLLALQLTLGTDPEYLCELYQKGNALRRLALDLDIKHDGSVTNEWLLELCTHLIWQVSRVNSQETVCFLVMMAGNEIECTVKDGKVRRTIRRLKATSVFAKMLNFDRETFPCAPCEGAVPLPGLALVQKAEVVKTGVHIYSNMFMTEGDCLELCKYLRESSVQRFGDFPAGMGFVEELYKAFDSPTSLRMPGNNKMVPCYVCKKVNSDQCAACLGHEKVDGGKPYGLSWVLKAKEGNPWLDEQLCKRMRGDFAAQFEATRLNFYPDAPADLIGTHRAHTVIPTYIANSTVKKTFQTKAGVAVKKAGVSLDVGLFAVLLNFLRNLFKEWANLEVSEATLKTNLKENEKPSIAIRFGRGGPTSSGKPLSETFCYYGKRAHDSLPLFIVWSEYGVVPRCQICNTPRGTTEEGKVVADRIKMSSGDANKLKDEFLRIVQPSALQIPQAVKKVEPEKPMMHVFVPPAPVKRTFEQVEIKEVPSEPPAKKNRRAMVPK